MYHDMPLEIRPTETSAMIYYVMCLHSELALLLLERESSSLTQLFEDAQKVEENIRASRWIRMQADSENLQTYVQEDSHDISDSEYESSGYETDLDQQPEGECISDSESVFSVCAEYSKDRYGYEFYDQFANQEEPMVTNDDIDNYIFSADQNSHDVKPIMSPSCVHLSEEEVTIFDDQSLISRRQEDDQSSCRETIMAEHEAAIDVQLFSEEQHVTYLPFKDPVAVFIDLYFSKNLEISDFLSLPVCLGKYGFLKDFLLLLIHVKHHLLIGEKHEMFSVSKLLRWLLWKSAFT